ncbi:hypothetical protein NE237_005807 [Protea cynaroides]|uniref:Uncharacterized protein n=1 Tax=Protea cynaroides TaxID=273540 RepID=A0A9Q0KL25_9MAGN|nr:hypothetical protein NE237_005807 [Protea cynaroides]
MKVMDGTEATPHAPPMSNAEANHESSGEISISEEACWTKKVVVEAKQLLWLAGPLIGVSILQYCLQIISIMFVGHLGELPLSGASMAVSFASVTGFSLLVSLFLPPSNPLFFLVFL